MQSGNEIGQFMQYYKIIFLSKSSAKLDLKSSLLNYLHTYVFNIFLVFNTLYLHN